MDAEEGPACKKARIDGDGADACASGDNAATTSAAPDAQMEMTASQVANMVAEMLAAVHQVLMWQCQCLLVLANANAAGQVPACAVRSGIRGRSVRMGAVLACAGMRCEARKHQGG